MSWVMTWKQPEFETARTIARPGRPRKKGETKSVQMNLKVTPSVKRRLDYLAERQGVSLSQLVERAAAMMETAYMPSAPVKRDWIRL